MVSEGDTRLYAQEEGKIRSERSHLLSFSHIYIVASPDFTIVLLSLSDQRRRDKPVCMWTRKRDRGTLPLPMPEMDHTTNSIAAMYPYSPGQSLLLSGREIAL
jgi:hypothetical protein